MRSKVNLVELIDRKLIGVLKDPGLRRVSVCQITAPLDRHEITVHCLFDGCG